jgi:hypothetical protein
MPRLKVHCTAGHLLEVVTPRTNQARLTPAEHLFGSLFADADRPEGNPVALEIVADAMSRRFFVRAGSVEQQQRVAGQITAAYPQAALRPLDAASLPTGDPLQLNPDEQSAVAVMRPRAGEQLPLRMLADRDLDTSSGSAQADPLLGLLAAMADLPNGWRVVAQLVVMGQAPHSWIQEHQHLALERPTEVSSSRAAGPSLVGPLLLLGLLAAYLLASSTVDAWTRHDLPGAFSPLVAAVGLAVPAVGIARWLGRGAMIDPRLVQAKLEPAACSSELRLGAFAPESAPSDALLARIDRLAAAYGSFSLATGNSLTAAPVPAGRADLRRLAPLGRPYLLNVRELAGLWHLIQADDDVPLVERTSARRRLPLPHAVAGDDARGGCKIGVSEHQGQCVPVYLSDALLRRHLLAVAKTRRGKSGLLLRIARHVMSTRMQRTAHDDSQPRALVLIDPHRDLALDALGVVPRERLRDVVYLDLSNRRRLFGLNLLDVGLGWDRDQAVSNALRIFRREFDGFWGPRMEDAFRFALMALFEANQAICATDPRWGRSSQHTILEVPALLSLRGFRRRVLKQVGDPSIKQWFDDYFDPLEPRLRQEVINPVQTKVHRYLGSVVARQIVGQPRSTVDFRQFVAERRIVLINLHAFDVGEDVAALVGGTLFNLAARAVSAQSALPPERRQAVTLIVDEFHTIPGADYEQVCGELAKYGANLVLATQTLARLDHLTVAQQVRDLRAAVFSNLDGLFAFHTSAEDARYLADELGGGLDEQDLLELAHFECYARLSDMRTGERLPAFIVRLDPPPTPDRQLSFELALASAERYGRDALEVELDRQAAIARIDGERRRDHEPTDTESTMSGWPVIAPGSGVPAPERTVVGGEVPNPLSSREPKKKQRSSRDRRSSAKPDSSTGRRTTGGPDSRDGAPEDRAEDAR